MSEDKSGTLGNCRTVHGTVFGNHVKMASCDDWQIVPVANDYSDLRVQLDDFKSIFYGPHRCPLCLPLVGAGTMIIKRSHAEGGQAYVWDDTAQKYVEHIHSLSAPLPSSEGTVKSDEPTGLCDRGEILIVDILHRGEHVKLNDCQNWKQLTPSVPLKSETVPTEAAKPKEDMPLTFKIEDGQIVIRIGIGVNAFAFEESSYNNPFVDAANDFKRTYKVTDTLEFAKDVIHAMQDEEEDGSSPLSDFLDKMAIAAVEDGSIAIEKMEIQND